MLLTGFNIAHYLIDKGFLSYQMIVKNSFSVRLASSRNLGYIVNENYFVKQVQMFESEKIETLRREASCYWLANNEQEYETLNKFLPKFYDYDTFNHILILEYLKNYINLHEFYYSSKIFPLTVAKQTAEILASYHTNIYKNAQQGKSMSLFRKTIPSPFLTFGKQMAFIKPRNKVEEEMQNLIYQHENFTDLIDKVKNEWEAKSLIHGDIKPTNFLINLDCIETNNFQLRLIDWEIADMGDPIWDVAAVMQSYLLMWLYGEPFEGMTDEEKDLAALRGFSLEQLQPSIGLFWEVYCQLMEFTSKESKELLIKTTRFCAIKLLHTCYESSIYAPNLSAQTVRMLQLSLNMLNTPEEAIETLFEIKNTVHA
jgi:thiamine kinase-like enzyme